MPPPIRPPGITEESDAGLDMTEESGPDFQRSEMAFVAFVFSPSSSEQRSLNQSKSIVDTAKSAETQIMVMMTDLTLIGDTPALFSVKKSIPA